MRRNTPPIGCLQCGHDAADHHTWTGSSEWTGQPESGKGSCWSARFLVCRCEHYVGADKLEAARTLAAHGLGRWDGLA